MFPQTLSLSHTLLRHYQGCDAATGSSKDVMLKQRNETGSSVQMVSSPETEAYRKVLKLGSCVQLGVVVQELHIPRLQHVVHTQGIAASNLIEESHGLIVLLCQARHISMSL